MIKNLLHLRWAIVYQSSLLLTMLFAACGRQHLPPEATIPLFVSIPRNVSVFDNFAPDLYEAIHQELINIGFIMHDTKDHAYTLALAIKSLEPLDKLISPDIVLLNYTIRLTCDLNILNYAGATVHTKTFTCSVLISKPINPILNSNFTQFAYTELANRAARMVSQYLVRHATSIFKP